ncbi:MAG: FlgD immunoglobulin-like domain containing protein [Candidatus Sumerlaeaceae bacterium]
MALNRILLSILLAAVASCSFAKPYPSLIRVSPATFVTGGTNITYVLNEAGSTVTIEILNAGNAVVATFAGTAVRGDNTVHWDGTANNAGGAAIALGAYKVRITAASNVAAAWTEFSSNAATDTVLTTVYKTLYPSFAPISMLIQPAQTSDNFGKVVCLTGNTQTIATNPCQAGITLNGALLTTDGTNGYASRLLRGDLDPAIGNSGSEVDYWGACFDPTTTEGIWIASQAGANKGFYAANSVADATTRLADPTNITGGFPRSVAVRTEGANKFAFFASGTNTINKIQIDSVSGNLTGAATNIVSFADINRYGRKVKSDSAGNLYYGSRRNVSAGTGGALYRWSAAKVSAAPGTLLNEANADWNIQLPAASTNLSGPAITPAGDVYVYVCSDGIYTVGNASTATLSKTLGAADLVVPLVISNNTFGNDIESDPAGNIIVNAIGTTAVANSQAGFVRGFSPGGNSSMTVTAPSSQAINIAPTAAEDWALFR